MLRIMREKILVEPLDHVAGKANRIAPEPALEQPPGAGADHAARLLERVANESARPSWKQDSFFRRYAGKG